MSQEAIERERIHALVEVIHSVLISLEDLDPQGASRLKDYWGRVITGVQERISNEIDWDALSKSEPQTAPVDEPAVQAPPPQAPAASEPERPIGMGSIDLFLSGIGPGQVEAAAQNPSEATPPSADDGDFFSDLPESPAESKPEPTPVADPEEIARLNQKIQELEKQNEDLKAQLSEPAPAVLSPGLSPNSVLQSLKVDTNAHGLRVDEKQLLEQFAILGKYFEGTDRNLTHVFSKLKLTINLQKFDHILASSFNDQADLNSHCEMLRDCWKILVGGTWNSLRSWCEKLQESLDPENIERVAKEQRSKPWVVYSEIYQRMSLYNNLIELLRTKIKAQIRDRQPSLLS